jgi:osmoprotectant transport system substrate-binding protein
MGRSGAVRGGTRALIAVMAATLAVSCSGGDVGPPITIGAGNSAQSELLAEIYAGALARTGARTAVDARLGRRADYLAALDAGTVTLVGDESGDVLAALDDTSTARLPDPTAAAAQPVGSGASTDDAGNSGPNSAGPHSPGIPSVADSLSRALPEGLSVSDIADGTDLRPAFVLPQAAAARISGTLADLAPRCGELTVGIATGTELDLLRRSPDPVRDVVAPLRAVYGCDIARYTVYPSDTALHEALRAGTVQAGVLTVPAVLLPGGGSDLATVADPDYAFRAENVVPLFRTGALTQVQIKKLNYVAGELTTAEFADMVRRVREAPASAAELARGWLDAHNL